MKFKLLSILSIFLIINACSSSNDETTGALSGTVSVDGSSTVFPVTEAVAEEFGKVHPKVRAQIMPGSTITKLQAEKEGLDKIFKDSGFEWRESGCSMCLGMNPDIIAPGERCASTSNRNFEGRQGKGGRTHLVSPEMAAAAAIEGHFVDVRDWK